MSFFSKLFAKLFGKKEKQSTFAPTPGVVYPTTFDTHRTAETPPYPTTGKFQQPEVERPRIPAITEPVHEAAQGWPPGAYEFPAKGSGNWYVKHGVTNAGPFKVPAEYDAWVEAVKRRDASAHEADRMYANTVYQGMFPAGNFLHGPGEGAEAAFIYAANCLYMETHDDTEYIYRRAGLFSGTHADIARLINYGEQERIFTHKNYAQLVAEFPDTPVGRAVREALAK